jgi:hypothetical protein
MKKTKALTITIITIISFMLSSCASKYYVQKQHSSGSYISWHGKHKKKYTKHSLVN